MEVVAEQAHREPAELHHDVLAFGDLPDRGAPLRKHLLASPGKAADSGRATAMVENDPGVGKCAGELGQLADLRMEQPGIEAQVQRREAGEALAEGRVLQQSLWP